MPEKATEAAILRIHIRIKLPLRGCVRNKDKLNYSEIQKHEIICMIREIHSEKPDLGYRRIRNRILADTGWYLCLPRLLASPLLPEGIRADNHPAHRSRFSILFSGFYYAAETEWDYSKYVPDWNASRQCCH